MQDHQNVAIWIDDDHNLSVRELKEEFPLQVQDGQVLVEVLFSGINPADKGHADYGMTELVTGYDFCGRVIEAGAGASYDVGDIIAGQTPSGLGRPWYYGTHQNYLVYPDELAFKVPENLPPCEAASLTVVLRTAADALFNYLAYPHLDDTSYDDELEPLVVWGGATSLGICTIQLAKAIGVETIIVTASSERHALLESLGATHCFDYNDPAVVTRIQEVGLQLGRPLLRGFDAAGYVEQKTAENTRKACAPTATVVSARQAPTPNIRMPFAQSETDVELDIPGRGIIKVPARVEDGQRAQSALEWAVEVYGSEFTMPHVTVLDGSDDIERAMQQVQRVGDGTAGFGKFVIKHPLRIK